MDLIHTIVVRVATELEKKRIDKKYHLEFNI